MNVRLVALLAVVGVAVAALAAVVLPSAEPSARADAMTAPVSTVVRNELGELKWMVSEAVDYTPLEAEGRRIYLQSGCTYCHSQYRHPVASETRPWGIISADPRRWGPAPEQGEYAYDTPVAFGARGIAPDLSRVGLKYSDEWHLAHFWNPAMITKGSIMGGFSGLFDAPPEPVTITDAPEVTLEDGDDARTLERTPTTERLFDFTSPQQVKLTPNDQGLLFVPNTARGKFPLIWTPNDEFTGSEVRLVAETQAIEALTAYVQKLGMNRGMWRELYEPDQIEGFDIERERSDEAIARGKLVYERHCIACHGVKGDGNGQAATFMHDQRPRNFTFGVFKFRRNKEPLPTDGDLLRTITRGVRGSAMPAWFELPLEDRLAVIQYVKYELTVDRSEGEPYYFFEEEPPGAPLETGTPPPPSAALVQHGREIWRQAKCWECHGDAGRGDGQKAAGLKDDWGFPIIPANLTRGLFKSGPKVTDIYRTISTGLTGTPMPSFQASFPEADRWALAYYILSLSAYTDPLSAKPLQITAAARAALNDPQTRTAGPEHAFGRLQPCTGGACTNVGRAPGPMSSAVP